MNPNWNYVPFDTLFEWKQKSHIKSGEGQKTGHYKMFVCSDTEVKRFDEYIESGESLVFGTGGKASCHFVDDKFAYSTDCVVAQKKKTDIYTKFYYYYFRQKRLNTIQKTFTGSGLQHTSKKKIGALLVPVVDFEEQKQIVAKIEELFSELDSSVETLQKIKQQLAVFHQSTIKKIFESCDMWITIESVCQHVTDGDHSPPPKAEQGIPFIMISNIENNIINWDNTAYVKEEYYNNIDNKRRPCEGDVLYTVTGSYGIPVLVNYEKNFCFQRHIALLRPNNKIHQKFLFYAMQEPKVYAQATKGATGTAQKTVGLGVLRKIKIPFCNDLNKQTKIVNDIETQLTVCRSLEETIDTALQQAEALRQSILKKAFEGEL